MTAWPSVTVLIVTYNRPTEIRKTIDALRVHLKYSGRIGWLLADDGSPDGYTDAIVQDYADLRFAVSVTGRLGWAGNVNAAMAACETEFIYLNEDDYVSLYDINLDKGIAVLMGVPEVGLIRYDGLDGHKLILEICETRSPIGRVPYLRVLWSSSGLNIYSNRPHLKHKRFHEHYGMYPIGLELGATETAFAHRVRKRHGLSIAALEDGITKAFDHIGHSRKGTAHDPCRPK